MPPQRILIRGLLRELQRLATTFNASTPYTPIHQDEVGVKPCIQRYRPPKAKPY